jgi:four helix bundle protein
VEKSYKKLLVWKKADEFAKQVYSETKGFPREEMYGVTSQLRRAALSISVNLVEGTGRQGKKELKQFANIALGSNCEAEYLLEFCFNLGYFSKDVYLKLENSRDQMGGLLWRFYISL